MLNSTHGKGAMAEREIKGGRFTQWPPLSGSGPNSTITTRPDMKWTSLGRGGTLAGVQREEHLLQSGNTRTSSTLVFQYADFIQFQERACKH